MQLKVFQDKSASAADISPGSCPSILFLLPWQGGTVGKGTSCALDTTHLEKSPSRYRLPFQMTTLNGKTLRAFVGRRIKAGSIGTIKNYCVYSR